MGQDSGYRMRLELVNIAKDMLYQPWDVRMTAEMSNANRIVGGKDGRDVQFIDPPSPEDVITLAGKLNDFVSTKNSGNES